MRRTIPDWMLILICIICLFLTVMWIANDKALADAEAEEDDYTVTGIVMPDDPESYGIDSTPEPQVETIVVIPTPTPKPAYKEREELPHYRLDNDAVETLCRLLWSSPLRSESEKVKLLWCVFNRIDDRTGRFGNTVDDVVTKTEFTFYDRKARISDRNRDLVESEMQRWMAFRDGYGIGWHPSTKGVFVRFVGNNNRKCELLSDPYGEALK